MSWLYPLALKQVSDACSKATLVIICSFFLAGITIYPIACLISVYVPSISNLIEFVGGVWILLMFIPTLLYYCVLVLYYCWDRICVPLYFFCAMVYHTLFLLFRTLVQEPIRVVMSLARRGSAFVLYQTLPFSFVSHRWTFQPGEDFGVLSKGMGRRDLPY